MDYRIDYWGFVYIWFDKKRNMYYIGSHYGSINDGYVCSSKRMIAAYRKRPSDFRRRILFWLATPDHPYLLEAEQKWLDLIGEKQLCTSSAVMTGLVRYYNHKKLAKGGSSKGHTKNRTAPPWNAGVTKEMLQLRRGGRFCLLCDKPKPRKIKRKARKDKIIRPPLACGFCSKNFVPKVKNQFLCSRSCSALYGNDNGEHARRMKTKRGKPTWNAGLNNPTAADNGRKGADKNREQALGRKREYRPDGSWVWSKK